MFNFHKDHRSLAFAAFIVFAGLSMLIAVLPAYQMQKTSPLPGMKEMTEAQKKGLSVYVSENCMACHTQQVRNIEMDNVWGERPSVASDYYYTKMRPDIWRQSPSLLGSERTGPDLSNVGRRQPGREWHLLHLYNPRIVVQGSVMPAYPWLFTEKDPSQLGPDDIVVPVPEKYLKHKDRKVVATQEVMDLVAYLQALKQVDLPGTEGPGFIPSSRVKEPSGEKGAAALPDGEALYMQTCAACHQADGKGVPGAFPPLAGSPVVNDENYETFIRIILLGYDARAEYGVMPGFAGQLADEEIAAIVNHERSSWGNKAAPISPEDVKRIRDYAMQLNP
ncbi:MAG: cbb3-type cytochrome c oxidase subunit II [Bacteroidia bacterium]|nr:cbb3-type cytochrome c oxidase subunit II [Bacteroidia bacterium]